MRAQFVTTSTSSVSSSSTSTSSTTSSATSTTSTSLPKVLRCEIMAARDAEKLVRRLAQCERRAKSKEVREKPFDLEGCRAKQQARFDRTLRARSRCPSCIVDGIGPIGQRTEAVTQQLGTDLYCDLSGGTPALRCGNRLLGRVAGEGGLVRDLVTCRVRASKADFRMEPFDEADCVVQARARFDGRVDVEGCGACVAPGVPALKESVVAAVDDNNTDAYCACVFGFGTCDDGNVCTTDSCQDNGDCLYDNNTNPCTDDGDPCTIDLCGGGECTHVPAANGTACLEDGDRCTRDACTDGVCTHTPLGDGAACSDGNACNGNETCVGGDCLPGMPLTCPPDGNLCTDDCNPTSGCGFVNNNAPCEDGNACTVDDLCVGGSCAGGRPLDCNDDDDCTADSCSATIGCLHTPIVGCP